jgi:hypothetical protein
MVVVVSESRVARFVLCAEDVARQATSSAQSTNLATRLSGTTTTTRTVILRQWHAVCSPDDRRKDAPKRIDELLIANKSSIVTCSWSCLYLFV